MFQHQQAAVYAYHQRFAGFAELLAVVRASLRLHLQLAKNTCAAPWGGEFNRGAHGPIFCAAAGPVNRPCAQLFRMRNEVSSITCSLPEHGLTIKHGGAVAHLSVIFFPGRKLF